MKRTVLRILTLIFGKKHLHYLISTLLRVLHHQKEKIKLNDKVLSLENFSVDGYDCFFGYYDLSSINEKKDKLLSIAVDKSKEGKVGFFNILTKEFNQIATTNAWNWQMGSRLRWFEDDRSVLFNDYIDGQFVSRVCELDGTEVKRFDYPLFDIDHSKSYGYYTDFSILDYLRNGYGYSNKNINFKQYYNTNNNGLFQVNLSTGKSTLLISVDDIVNHKSNETMESCYHYFNHISVNPYSGVIMFFHIWTDYKLSDWKCRMVLVKNDGELINIIGDFDKVSHYTWKNETEILATVVSKGKVEYRLYNINKINPIHINERLNTDGHPTYIDNDTFITDTYPNKFSMQKLLWCNEKDLTDQLLEIYHQPKKINALRCDLHPRYKDGLVNFDSNVHGRRSQFLITIDKNNN
ncbi:hypothetical protein [Paenibacillus sp.]|uniref:hypothetical protein n=1 Tax=Paenibacillus sp. TaxID=58172 RepID=UPI002D5CCE50|nr:hypothetical protein [Paenibacillus sp.]HZG84981.1 hypothetical protein [Paenibacillus sp.]